MMDCKPVRAVAAGVVIGLVVALAIGFWSATASPPADARAGAGAHATRAAATVEAKDKMPGQPEPFPKAPAPAAQIAGRIIVTGLIVAILAVRALVRGLGRFLRPHAARAIGERRLTAACGHAAVGARLLLGLGVGVTVALFAIIGLHG